MNLKIQIFSLIFSFFYGILFSFLINVHYQFLFFKKKWVQIVVTILFLLDMALLYFLILRIINNGIIHIYFYLMIFLGFYLTFPVLKKIRKK